MMVDATAGAEAEKRPDWALHRGNEDSASHSTPTIDLAVDQESGFDGKAHLLNTTVHNFTWRGVTVTVKDRNTKEPRHIVNNVEGIVEAGMYLCFSSRDTRSFTINAIQTDRYTDILN